MMMNWGPPKFSPGRRGIRLAKVRSAVLALLMVAGALPVPVAAALGAGTVTGTLYNCDTKQGITIGAGPVNQTVQAGQPYAVTAAIVQAYDYNTSKLINTSTLGGSNGAVVQYTISGLNPGKYLIVAAGVQGFAASSHPVQVGTGAAVQDLYLCPLPHPTGWVTVRIFNDVNSNIGFDKEPGMSNVEVSLIDEGTGRIVETGRTRYETSMMPSKAQNPSCYDAAGQPDPNNIDCNYNHKFTGEGLYTFKNVPPGKYEVESDVPPGWIQSLGSAEGGTGPEAAVRPADPGWLEEEAGIIIPSIEIGLVRHPLNANSPDNVTIKGRLIDDQSGEPVVGAHVAAVDVGLGTAGVTLGAAQSDANGYYEIKGLPVTKEKYIIAAWDIPLLHKIINFSEAEPCAKTPGGVCVADIRMPNWFAQFVGSVYKDLNGNGVRDAGEPGIPGVKVNVKTTRGVVLLTTSTRSVLDPNHPEKQIGDYEFIAAPPLEQVNNNGARLWRTTYAMVDVDAAGGHMTSGPSSKAILAIQGGKYRADFGMKPDATTGAITGEVFHDSLETDYTDPTLHGSGAFYFPDGNRDRLEPGIPSVQLELLDSNGRTVATATSSGFVDPMPVRDAAAEGVFDGEADGRFAFQNLAPGEYALVQSPVGTDYLPTSVVADGVVNSQPQVDAQGLVVAKVTVSPGVTTRVDYGNTFAAPVLPGGLDYLVFDDLYTDLRPWSPNFGEKAGIPYASVAVVDYMGNVLDVVITNQWGFNWAPVAPGVWETIGNDPKYGNVNPCYGWMKLPWQVTPANSTLTDIAMPPLCPTNPYQP